MDFLSKSDLKTLLEHHEQPSVSLYMPTVKAGSETQQNPIRFKNLMKEVESKLEEMGIRLSDASEWLEQAKKLDDLQFWEHQELGLAIFISPTAFHYYLLPIEVDEIVVVSDRFHLKPLLPLVNKNGRYFILALSQDNIRLIEATQFSARELHVENIPDNLDQALMYDEFAQTSQFRTFTSHGGSRHPAPEGGIFHGQGSPDIDKIYLDILQYFHQVDKGIFDRLKDEDAPLVLAGVEYLMPLYHQANSYQHLLADGMAGNPKMLKPEELQTLTWEIVQPYFEKSYTEAVQRYQDLSGAQPDKTVTKLEEIVSAAYYQRLDSLFVALDYHQWGQFNPETNQVEIHEEAQPDDEDLLDFAAVYTAMNGGTVYVEPQDKMPGEGAVAAIARF